MKTERPASGHCAEVIRLPGLHERPVTRTAHLLNGLRPASQSAEIIAFPERKDAALPVRRQG
ncbi:hypothetical protein [Rhizobium paknamense]|uniref:Uncharacterized protein n=1 Tax=Rhizobium paknamense TaxID=1206817 RepID=A0ABU0I822_9HYPH|nr:hypothetical protein [Rhizobium paknamense]MDQ0454384.1 hypothetical protein [Rhizobium paknamense]